MLYSALIVANLMFSLAAPLPRKTVLEYTLRFDPSDLTGISVELRVRNAPRSVLLAAHAHPEYDDKYWRYVDDLRATDMAGQVISVAREDSVLWRMSNKAGDVIVRYRVRFPSAATPRDSWKPFLAPTGGLIGGPHSFLYAVGFEHSPVMVTLDIPANWRVGTGLSDNSTARTFSAPGVLALMEAPMLVGALREWTFRVQNVPHRILYWPLPNATPFDSVALVNGIERIATQAFALFGSAPYKHYTFLLQDGAYGGGLEHPNSVTLGALSADLAKNPHGTLSELSHEYVHTWNLMAITPAAYRGVDFRVQPPVPELWFSEGLTMFYADLLRRRAGLVMFDTTRLVHLQNLIARYQSAPGNSHFSAEHVSRVAYNAPPSAMGDYTASAHLQGELIGGMLDFRIRGATDGRKSMDDVMRLMYTRFQRVPFQSNDVQKAVQETCTCKVDDVFDTYVRNAGAINFNNFLAPFGLTVSTTWSASLANDGKPNRDLSVWGWLPENDTVLRLRVTKHNGVWARSGIHTNDQLISVNGAAMKTWPEFRAFLATFAIGDTATIAIKRNGVASHVRVVMTGFESPVVRIIPSASAAGRQRALQTAWLEGR